MKYIEDGNKTIAEFMDADILYLPPTGMYQNRSISDKCSRYEELVIKYKYKAILKYHSSWDWLMPVVEKITKIDSNFILLIGNVGAAAKFESQAPEKDVWPYHGDKAINATYKAVVNFIKWHNENT